MRENMINKGKFPNISLIIYVIIILSLMPFLSVQGLVHAQDVPTQTENPIPTDTPTSLENESTQTETPITTDTPTSLETPSPDPMPTEFPPELPTITVAHTIEITTTKTPTPQVIVPETPTIETSTTMIAISTPSEVINQLLTIYPGVDYLFPGNDSLSQDVKDAIGLALISYDYEPPKNGRFSVLAMRIEKDWAIATLTSSDMTAPPISGQDTSIFNGKVFNILLVRENGGWRGAIEGKKEIYYLSNLIPESELSSGAKNALFFSATDNNFPSDVQSLQLYNSYKFPWPSDRPWHVHGSWHDGLALDFDVVDNTNSDVLSAGPGYITSYIQCSPSDHYIIRVSYDNANEKLTYIHLEGASVRAQGLYQGLYINQGRKLGIMAGAFSGTDSCGIVSTGSHLHFVFPSLPFTIDGKTFSSTNYYANENLYSTQNSGSNGVPLPSGAVYCADEGGTCSFSGTATVYFGANNSFFYKTSISNSIACNNSTFGDPANGVSKKCYYVITSPPPSSCPSVSGEVRLYDGVNCSGGYAFATSPGLWDLSTVFNDQGESLAIPSGWSAKLYKDNTEASPSICKSSTDSNLNDDTFSDGSGVGNATTWMRVYNTSGCPSSVPSAPSLTGPISGTYFYEGDSITLYWSGSATDYYGEILGGPGGPLSFGWQTGTSKSIGSQWPGYTYSWHVKARNSSGESGYSETRTFTVKPKAPTSLSGSASSCTSSSLSWTDQSGNEDGFRIYRNGSAIGTTTGTSYSNTGLSPSTSYSYFVKSYKGSVESDPSNTVMITIMSCPIVPANPSLSSPANGYSFTEGDIINLSWTGTGTDYYGEIWGGPGSTLYFGWQTGTSKNIGSQWPGYTYSWHVKTRNSNGETGYSETRAFIVKPKAPTSLAGSASSCTSASMSWIDQSANEDGYRIYRNGSAIATTTGTSYANSGLSSGISYSYSVKAYKGSIESDASNTLTLTIPSCSFDYITNPRTLTTVPYLHTYTTTNMTLTSGEPALTGCNRTAGAASVWYKYTPSVSREVSLDTYGSNYDTMIGVWRGAPESLTEVKCNDDNGGVLQSALTFTATQGNDYYIGISQYNGNITGVSISSSEVKSLPEVNALSGGSLVFHSTTFSDVPGNNSFWRYIEGFNTQGITTGCAANPKKYCPNDPVTRAAMAVFLLRAEHGSSYQPPVSTGLFSDLPVSGKEWMQPWVEQFFREGITTGCAVNPSRFCPESSVTRAAMAIYVLRAVHGTTYQPPVSTGIFSDVPVVGKEWMTPWVEQFYREGYTTGCGVSPLRFCPEDLVTRGSMAVFIDRAYGIGLLP
jgi:hypothetical protein